MTILTVGEVDAELTARLDRELTAFNNAATGADDVRDLSVRVDDEDGEFVGGLTGWTWGGTCGISLLWVRADRRSEGWGGHLVTAAENEARRRGCTRVVLSSFTFQAPDFYRARGYVETGRAEGYPAGSADIHFVKYLAPAV